MILFSKFKINYKTGELLMINFFNISKYSTNNCNKMESEQNKKKKIALISAKMNFGQGKRGTELGPNNIKQDFLFNNLENLDYEVFDHAMIEDIIVDQEIKYFKNRNIYSLGQTNQKLSFIVKQAIEHNFTPIVIGGDHSLAIGSVDGTAAALSKHSSEIGLIWIDAHADINTPLTTASGNLHGQPVSFLLKELDEYLPRLRGFEWQLPCISARNLVYIGLRDLDTEETILIKNYGIKAFSMSDVHRLGIQQVMKETLEYLTIDGTLLPLHCSVDIDSLDPWFAPCTGTPVLGGLSLTELMFIGNAVHETGKLKTLDLVEVNPLLGTNEADVNKTVFSAMRTILSFFGYNTIGTMPPMQKIPKPRNMVIDFCRSISTEQNDHPLF